MRKKIACLLLVYILGSLLVACGKEAPEETTVPTTEPVQVTEPVQTTAPTEDEPATEPTEVPTEPATESTPAPPTDPRAPVLEAPEIQSVDESFFDDAVFVGDSISLKLTQYAASSGSLGNAKFLTVSSLGVHNAVDDHPETQVTYRGVRYKDLEKAIAATGAKKVFIMFGMNDIGYYGIDSTMSYWSRLLEMIYTACGEITVYIQSMTPVWTGGERGTLNNANVLAYNEQLKAFADANGCAYIDIHPYMTDSTGGLATKYCADKYVHLTKAGAKTWVAVLKAYSGY